jgi:Ca2+-binding RTX toxin-like protein
MKPVTRSILVIAAAASLLATAAPQVSAAAARYCLGKKATIVGTAGSDRLHGTAGADVIVGQGGDDHIGARKAKDRVCGGSGNDILVGGRGNDTIKGGPGNDSLSGYRGDEVLDGGPGRDAAKFRLATKAVTASLETNTASGEGLDTLTGIEQLWGSNFNDTLTGDNGGGGNELVGAAGDDVLTGLDGADNVVGNKGNDTLDGGDGFDVLDHQILSGPGPIAVDFPDGTVTGVGSDTFANFEGVNDTPGDDTFQGDATSVNFNLSAGGNDTVDAAGGNDFVIGGGGDDTLDGGPGTDFLSFLASPTPVTVDLEAGTSSGEGTDTATDFEVVFGSPYDDVLDGDNDDNFLLGQGGNDVIRGFAGSDHLEGGIGTDDLDGGPGNDSCLEAETLANCE